MNPLDKDKLLVEIYKDVAQPMARTMGGTLNFLVDFLIGVETNKKRIELLKQNLPDMIGRLSKKLEKGHQINEKPRLNIALPILESLSLIEDRTITDMFGELLAKELTVEESQGILPVFVHILKNITSDEAKILSLFKQGIVIDQKHILEQAKPTHGRVSIMPFTKIAWVEKNEKTGQKTGNIILKNYSPPLYELDIIHNNLPAYIDNLISLGIIATSLDNSLSSIITGGTIPILDYDAYVGDQSSYQGIIKLYENTQSKGVKPTIELDHGNGQLTDFGRKFLQACGC